MELKLSKPDVKVVTDKEKGTSESVRKIEVGLLQTVFGVAFQLPDVTKDVKKSSLATDLYQRVENLTDTEETFTLEKDDLDIFHAAWSNAQFRRSPIWLYAGALLKQLG